MFNDAVQVRILQSDERDGELMKNAEWLKI
jgi:hypothetical protein